MEMNHVTCALRFLPSLLFLCLQEPFWSILNVEDLGEEIGRNWVVAKDTTVHCLVRRLLRRFRINHKHQKHDASSSGGTTCTSRILVQWRNDCVCTAFVPLFCPKPPGTSPPELVESSFLRNQYNTAMVRSPSQS